MGRAEMARWTDEELPKLRDDLRKQMLDSSQLRTEFLGHVEKFEAYMEHDDDRYNRLLMAQEKTADAQEKMADNLNKLVDQISPLIEIYAESKTIMKLGRWLYRFLVTLAGIPILGAGLIKLLSWLGFNVPMPPWR